jgi:hypothetical protein
VVVVVVAVAVAVAVAVPLVVVVVVVVLRNSFKEDNARSSACTATRAMGPRDRKMDALCFPVKGWNAVSGWRVVRSINAFTMSSRCRRTAQWKADSSSPSYDLKSFLQGWGVRRVMRVRRGDEGEGWGGWWGWGGMMRVRVRVMRVRVMRVRVMRVMRLRVMRLRVMRLRWGWGWWGWWGEGEGDEAEGEGWGVRVRVRVKVRVRVDDVGWGLMQGEDSSEGEG